MEWLHQILKSVEPVQYVYGAIAICGGIARYLSGYASGKSFSVAILLASAFVSGFSGWMFALMGTSLHQPQTTVYIMAGLGGFFGEQCMKYMFEWVQQRLK